jgi:hypothetical protein
MRIFCTITIPIPLLAFQNIIRVIGTNKIAIFFHGTVGCRDCISGTFDEQIPITIGIKRFGITRLTKFCMNSRIIFWFSIPVCYKTKREKRKNENHSSSHNDSFAWHIKR